MTQSGELRLVVGLGNPGEKYASTRHNVGFMALEQLASREGGRFKVMGKLQGELADVGTGDARLRLLMPQTFMNESGRSIRAALDWFGFDIHQLIVLVDDMDLPLGRLRLRAGGGAGGHNGLKSTIQHLGTQQFARLRIGIGAPGRTPEERRARTVSHVLGQFNRDEEPLLKDVLNEVLRGLERIQRQGLDRAGNHLNGLNLAPLTEDEAV
ncbi:peptidyl-tRNA hydrolase [Synechococcus sp. A18-25c]|mgnify:FL=1|uniref:aminoacyl-tRNA hydrolase n=1 Tax=unclassified Synechococcus TaxID=2626047 RepID=UPI001647C3D5|nr:MULTISPECIES: aminoacyl-tRNA hydrolase [unclassified Synechococcus]MEC7896664.1 aminoacyl-tRNA hydrolase [Cyanobacteriota bacterium]QNJ18651.1 peptidyl-tRNA hydrolase [Synechococcus sp. A18-25c]